MYITTMDYLTPSGYNLSNKGIPPQVVVERTPGSKVDEQLDAAIKLLKANNPDPLTTPVKDDAKKQFGEGDWTSNPVAIAAGCALFMLLIVFAASNHVLANRRRKEEAKRDGESE
jgi:hypothetical protein